MSLKRFLVDLKLAGEMKFWRHRFLMSNGYNKKTECVEQKAEFVKICFF